MFAFACVCVRAHMGSALMRHVEQKGGCTQNKGGKPVCVCVCVCVSCVCVCARAHLGSALMRHVEQKGKCARNKGGKPVCVCRCVSACACVRARFL